MEKIERIINTEAAYIHDIQAMNRHRQDDRLQTSTIASVTLSLAHESFDILAHEFTVGFFMASFQIRNDPFIGRFVRTAAAKIHPVFLSPGSVKYFLKIFLTEILDLRRNAETMSLSNFGQPLHIPGIGIHTVIWTDGAFGNRKIGIKNQIGIDLKSAAKTSTDRTSTLRCVETEQSRLKLRNLFIRMVDTSVPLRICEDLLGIGIQELHDATAKLQSLFDGLRDTADNIRPHGDTVDNDFDIMFVVLVEFRKFIECIDDTVDAGTGIPALGILFGNMRELAFLTFDDRCQDEELRPILNLHNLIDNRLRRTTSHLFATDRTMRNADASEQKS